MIKNIFAIAFLFTVYTVPAHALSYICTADAKLCPDGSYVGRTGPNCEFKCPADGDIPPVEIKQCVDLKNNMFIRSRDSQTNGEVTDLQEFLSDKYFSPDPTGYFGRVTLIAVQAFQRDHGLKAFGYVGPATRAKIKSLTCNSVEVPQAPFINELSPKSGSVGTRVTIYGSNIDTATEYILMDGYRVNTDGSKVAGQASFIIPETLSFLCNPIKPRDPCPALANRQVTPGVYNIQVSNRNGTSKTLQFTVTTSLGVARPNITSLSPSQARVGTQVAVSGNGINIGGDKIYFGGALVPQSTTASADIVSVLRFVVPEYITPCGVGSDGTCKIASQLVTLGNYEVVVVNANGTSNVLTFTVTSVNSSTPTISSVSGPQTLQINQQGTWTVTATNANGGNLSYSVVWGDEGQTGSSVSAQAPQQTATFNKSYARTGIFTPRFTVTNSAGQSVSASLSVSVGNITTPAIPTITSITPTSGTVGTQITVIGTGFIAEPWLHYFRFMNASTGAQVGNAVILNRASSPTSVTFAIPTDIPSGAYRIQARVAGNGNTWSNSSNQIFTLNASQQTPAVSYLSPSAGVIGTRVTVYGSNIDTGNEYVLFNGYRLSRDGSKVAGQVSFIIPEYLSQPCVQVRPTDPCPAGALIQVIPGTYTVSVGNANGVSNTLSFNVISYGIENPLISKFQVEDVATTNSVSRKLVWTTQFANVCTASGAWSGTQPVNGSYSIGFMSQSLTYTLTCSNSQGVSVSRSVVDPIGNATQAPVISSLSPLSGATNSQVIISGTNLNSASDFVLFGGLKLTPDRSSKALNVLIFTVPATLYQCSGYCTDVASQPTPLGNYNIKVENAAGMQSGTLNYQVTSNSGGSLS